MSDLIGICFEDQNMAFAMRAEVFWRSPERKAARQLVGTP
jgi:hypothetical protein